MMSTRQFAATLVALAAWAASAAGAVTPEQKCEGGMNDKAGKYAACVAKAEKKLVVTGDAADYGDAVAACEQKLADAWNKLEAGAVGAGTMCHWTGDHGPVQSFLDACLAGVATAMSSGDLPVDVATCNTGLDSCTADLSTTNADLTSCTADLATATVDLATCEGELSAANTDLAFYQAVLAPVTTGGLLYGYPSEFAGTVSHTPQALAGFEVVFPQPVVVTHLGVIGKTSTGAKVQLVLYSDSGGDPDQVMVATGPATVVVGPQELPVTPTLVPAGSYWLMANYDDYVGVGIELTGTETIKYNYAAFNDPPPDPFGTVFTATNGGRSNYYIRTL